MPIPLFKQNLGLVDRLVRIVFGLDMLSIAIYGPRTAWGWLGLIPLATVLLGTCPLYTALGIDTRRPRSNQRSAQSRLGAAPAAAGRTATRAAAPGRTAA
jgi:hypothetical protein